tara:strand:+ start:1647 stop:2705 length:1059 start_codon:yes stop_codon:yes gene_type:complete
MKSIFVTGGAGFIGSHTCLLLLEKGYVVFILDSFVNSYERSLERISYILKNKGINTNEKIYLIKGDIKNLSDIEKVFQMGIELNKEIESVIHFAGLKSVFESVIDPLIYWDNNVRGTINLLKIMKKFNCRNIVFSSSATVYKSKAKTALNENDVCAPVNPYGDTKLTIEKLLGNTYKSSPNEWRIACLRYFNPAGAHESGLIGEDPLGRPDNLYPRINRVAVGKLHSIKIFGSDWPTKDGTCIRDYIHVMDVAEGHLLALNYLVKENPQFLTLNLGTGKGTSVLELIRTFEKVNKIKIPFIFEERRLGDNSFVVADNSLAKSILNWIPHRSIDDICRDGYNWQLQNPKGFSY